MAVKKWLQVVGVMQVVGEEAAAAAVVGAVAFATVVTAAFGVFVCCCCCCEFNLKGGGCGTVTVARELSIIVSHSSDS